MTTLNYDDILNALDHQARELEREAERLARRGFYDAQFPEANAHLLREAMTIVQEHKPDCLKKHGGNDMEHKWKLEETEEFREFFEALAIPPMNMEDALECAAWNAWQAAKKSNKEQREDKDE